MDPVEHPRASAPAEYIAHAPRPLPSSRLEAGDRVADLMRRDPRVVRPGEPLGAIAYELLERGEELVLVVDRGMLAGVVSSSRVAAALREPPGAVALDAAALMETRVFVARPEWPVAQAAAVMVTRGLVGLPVVASGARIPEGVIGRGEVLAWLVRRCGYRVGPG